jgi:hypothetical protein
MRAVGIEDVLFPGIDVRVTAVRVTAEQVAVEASSFGRPPSCPDCGGAGHRVHSRYVRRVTERPGYMPQHPQWPSSFLRLMTGSTLRPTQAATNLRPSAVGMKRPGLSARRTNSF